MKLIVSASLLFLPLLSIARVSLVDKIANSHLQHITLLGSVRCIAPESLLGLPVLYKGDEYEVNKKGDFELYDSEKPKVLYIVITEYLKIPDESNVEHLRTSPDHPYLYYKLTKMTKEIVDTKRLDLLKNHAMIEITDTWQIERLDNSEKIFEIPDNTVILFLDPTIIDRLEEVTWSGGSTGLRLPTIVLKDNIEQKLLADLAVRMKLAVLDFKFMHKKPYKAYMPCGNNHLLSMPFRARGYC